MEHDGLYDHLLLLGLLWLSMLLYWGWLRGRPVTSLPRSRLLYPSRNASKEPKPFAGLLYKPLCDACEQAAASRPHAPCAPPPPLTFTRGRRRTVETGQQFCPDDECSYYGWEAGAISARTGIRAASHGGSSSVCRARGISRRRMAPRCMGSGSRPTCSSGLWGTS